MLDLSKDTQPITNFRRQSGDFLKQLKKTKRPIVLTETCATCYSASERMSIASCMKSRNTAAQSWCSPSATDR